MVTATSLTVTAPAGTGTVDVTVTTQRHLGANASSDHYTYNPPPTVTGGQPEQRAPGRGNSVTVTGTGFVTGATPSTSGPPGHRDHCDQCHQPHRHLPGGDRHGLRHRAPRPADLGTVPSAYTYNAAPTVTGVSPNNGPAAGGNIGHGHRNRLHRRHRRRLRLHARAPGSPCHLHQPHGHRPGGNRHGRRHRHHAQRQLGDHPGERLHLQRAADGHRGQPEQRARGWRQPRSR